MMRLRHLRGRIGGGAALAAVALLVAACGSSASKPSASTSGAGATSASTSTASGAPAAAVTASIATTSGSAGTFLTGAGGRALYLWDADKGGKSNCSGACAAAWPPLLTKSAPHAKGGVKAGDLATVTRSGGVKQVTYKGHPLYYFAGDTHSGTTTGQGSNEFGAQWWLVNTAGSAITSGSGSGGASAAASSSTSGSSGGGY